MKKTALLLPAHRLQSQALFQVSLLAMLLGLAGCDSARNVAHRDEAPTQRTAPAEASATANTAPAAADAATSSNADSTIAANDASNSSVDASERLGTRWGDEISSPTRSVDAERTSSTPVAEMQVRYAQKDFAGRRVNSIALAQGQLEFSVQDENGQPWPLYRAGSQYYLAGQDGESYQLHYENHSNQTYEIVASVDGLDVINGTAASRSHDGYVLRPHDSLNIEGFRKSSEAVASFTFSAPKHAYAANSEQGDIANTGVIGTVVYTLKLPGRESPRRFAQPPSGSPAPSAFPAD